MSGGVKLEDFGGPPQRSAATTEPQETPDAGYEDGYRAGWDDAVAAAEQDQSRVTEDLAKSLADISFGYTEARSHVLNCLAPVLSAMAEKLLPEAAHAHFAETVLAAAEQIAARATDHPVELAVAPDARVALEAVMPETLPFAIDIVEDPHLGPGQARMRAADMEKVLDIAEAETAIRSAVSDFLTLQSKEVQHG
ncbi:flagellar biosynthesis protein [Actibacterium ureilyticum]|uniref:FliH/SctL family protein n=1 Tax=Actibacterium ureilyticum TaxID=1590614 RepID=UPI000BAAC16F|nr:flagellar biosynthesis protein [Actibacterium ureilyticum]